MGLAPAARRVPPGETTPAGTTVPSDVAPHRIERFLKRGAVWTLGSQLAVQGVRFAGVIVLARLLTPDAYGVAALAVTIGSFSAILGDFGYGMALIQAKTVTQRWASTAFWCALGAGAAGSVIVAIGAYPAALALDEPEVAGLAIVGGMTLFLVGAGAASNALLTRSMSFGLIQGATLVAWVLATGSAVTAAALGAGAWALVLQQVVLATVTTVWVVLAARWRPSPEFSREAFRWFSKFALPVTGTAAFGVLQLLVTVLLIGHLAGVEDLGIWNFAMALVMVPASLIAYPLTKVVYGAFARLRDTPERVAMLWLNAVTMLAAAVLPTLFGLIALAPDLVPLAFGDQWTGSVAVIQLLTIFMMARALQTCNSPVMDAAGKPQIGTLLNATVLVGLPPAILIGNSLGGLEGIAIGFNLAVLICGEIPSFVVTTRELSLSAVGVLKKLRGIAFCAAVACIAAVLVRQALEDSGMAAEPRLLLSLFALAGAYCLALALFARGSALDLVRMARTLGPALRPER
jgi:polysaccharide transporter, PST family